MIEAIVAAALLVIVALGVLKGLDTAQRSSGREKARSVAAALTEQDQERLRSFRAVDLANYDETATVDGQQGQVHDQVAGRLGPRLDRRHRRAATTARSQADYMRITSTTTSALINTPDPADHDVEPRRAARRRVRHQPGHARRPGQQPRRRGRRRHAGHDHRSRHADEPDELRRLRDLRLRPGRQLHRHASPAPAGSTRAATRPPPSARPSARARSTSRRSTYDQAASVDVTFDTETLGGADRRRATTTQLSASNAGVPTGPFSPFAGLRVYDPAGGARRHDHRHRPVPVLRRLRPLRRRLPRRRPDESTTPTTTRPTPSAFIDVEPGRGVAAGRRSACPRSTCGCSTTATRSTRAQSATTKILVTSKSPDCTEKFSYFAAPAADRRERLDARAGAAVRRLRRSASSITPAHATQPPLRRRSPASRTGTTAASSCRTSPVR